MVGVILTLKKLNAIKKETAILAVSFHLHK